MILETLYTIIDWLPILIAVSCVCLVKESFDDYWCIKTLQLPEYVYMHGFLFRSIFKFSIWLVMVISVVAGGIISFKLMSSAESVFLTIICSIPVGLGVVVAALFQAYANDRFLHDHSDTSKISVNKFIDIKNNATLLNLIEKQKIINEMEEAYWADLKKNFWKFKIDR